jgi:acyl-coenzyme A synthetase/AMP-(fatty) acid ligase
MAVTRRSALRGAGALGLEFVDSLPMTATGKIKRGELKARELQRRSDSRH